MASVLKLERIPFSGVESNKTSVRIVGVTTPPFPAELEPKSAIAFLFYQRRSAAELVSDDMTGDVFLAMRGNIVVQETRC